MAPRGVFAAIRRLPLKCEAGRARGGARARTIWSSGGLVRPVERSPARSVLAHPRRRARTPNGLFRRPRPKVGAAGGLARERWRVAPSRPRTSSRARQRARERASAEGSVANDLGQAAFERAGAAAWQAACGAAGFRSPTGRLRLRRPSDARSAERGEPKRASERRAERGARRRCLAPLPASARRLPGCV